MELARDNSMLLKANHRGTITHLWNTTTPSLYHLTIRRSFIYLDGDLVNCIIPNSFVASKAF
jgi:hypothetical protein